MMFDGDGDEWGEVAMVMMMMMRMAAMMKTGSEGSAEHSKLFHFVQKYELLAIFHFDRKPWKVYCFFRTPIPRSTEI